ncbi:myelin protein zero-like protein 1 [Carcharodon carcharias]|uniref:myelin protein zero-like protein 1 n=1 Tax=Carcharodon carcharias TaxID=13397 RepID=UPI001B7E2540|nr:myelin protein zero-like protein 1 [Carcharodon carcharias]
MAAEQCATTALFLLISICTTGIEAATPSIVQSPASVHIFEGGSVTLNCTFRLTGLGTYSWRRDDSPIDFQSPRYKKRIMKADHDAFSSRKDASIQIKNMTQCESGTYYCEIEIMGKQKLTGIGTLVTVQHTCDKLGSLKTHPLDWMWVAVAGGVTLLFTLALLVVIIVLARRNKAYALLVRECSSLNSAKELELPQRNKVRNHAEHEHEVAYSHCRDKEGKTKKNRPPLPKRTMQ